MYNPKSKSVAGLRRVESSDSQSTMKKNQTGFSQSRMSIQEMTTQASSTK
jgi:hypothetical protein